MNYKNIELISSSGCLESLSNLNFHRGTTIMDIYDAIEDAKTPQDICKNINKINMVMNKWILDRTTDKYVRLKYTDVLGNIKFLKIELE